MSEEKTLICCTCGKMLKYQSGQMYYMAANNDWYIDDDNDHVLCDKCNERECVEIALRNGDL